MSFADRLRQSCQLSDGEIAGTETRISRSRRSRSAKSSTGSSISDGDGAASGPGWRCEYIPGDLACEDIRSTLSSCDTAGGSHKNRLARSVILCGNALHDGSQHRNVAGAPGHAMEHSRSSWRVTANSDGQR